MYETLILVAIIVFFVVFLESLDDDKPKEKWSPPKEKKIGRRYEAEQEYRIDDNTIRFFCLIRGTCVRFGVHDVLDNGEVLIMTGVKITAGFFGKGKVEYVEYDFTFEDEDEITLFYQNGTKSVYKIKKAQILWDGNFFAIMQPFNETSV